MPEVQRICDALPKERQTLLFSATLDGNIGRIAQDILNNPVTIQVAAQKEKHENIEQRLHHVDDLNHKNKLLEHLLIEPNVNQAIIFTSTKRHADLLAEDLYAAGHKTAALHGDMTQGARNRTLTKLRHGDVKVLVATDVAARGIDVKGITHVINYDLPKFAEDYVHRIGRTGRAGQKGIAIAFASNMDRHVLRKIEQYTGQKLQASVIEGFEPKRPINMDAPEGKRSKSRNSRNGSARSGGYKDRGRSDGENGRNFRDRTATGRPARSKNNDKRYSDKLANNRTQRNDKQITEVNGNSVHYTKDTNLQFAKEVARGSGNGRHQSNRNASANKGYASISNEKFGNPRPKRNGSNTGNHAQRRTNNDSARRSRNFA
jgi:superfamily II DNA/RNA helicase